MDLNRIRVRALPGPWERAAGVHVGGSFGTAPSFSESVCPAETTFLWGVHAGYEFVTFLGVEGGISSHHENPPNGDKADDLAVDRWRGGRRRATSRSCSTGRSLSSGSSRSTA